MINSQEEFRKNPATIWELDDKTFFATVAGHILAYAFLEKFPNQKFKALWIRPHEAFTGHHVFVSNGKYIFDSAGFRRPSQFFEDLESSMEEIHSDWSYDLIELDKENLVSKNSSKEFAKLGLLKTEQFLHDPLPRAREYLKKFNLPSD